MQKRSKKLKRIVLTSILALFFVVVPIYGGVIQALEEGGILTTSEEERAVELFRQLRCLSCEGQSVAESHADFARSIRELIRKNIAQGMEDKMILESLRENYGDVIFFEPPLNISTFLLWILPFSMIIFGFSAFVIYLRKQKIA